MGEATGKVGGDTAPTQHQPGNVPSLQQAGALLGKLHEHEAIHGLGTTLRGSASEVCVPREDVLQVLLPLSHLVKLSFAIFLESAAKPENGECRSSSW